MFADGKVVAVDGEGSETDIAGAQAVLALYRSYTRIYDDNNTPHTLHMTSNVLDTTARVTICTIQRLFSMLKGIQSLIK